ncbi:MAG TPA: PrsW family glutamic-type intramembrane protease [Ktedonobacterales bacterium]|nr:PrsW family glutamic-type intramembrane protease [Ktedonobacterales bacterium]
MESCLRCGARVGPGDRSCPACGVPLSSSLGPAPGPKPEITPLAQAPREFSLNGNTPQPPAADSAAAQPSGERWGPVSWGPGTPPMSELPPAAPGAERSAQPSPAQPPVLREYSAGYAPRPYPPYRPPAGPRGPAPRYPGPGYPIVPPSRQPPAYPGYPLQPGYAPYPYPPYPGMPGYPYGWYPPRPRAPGETYHKVLGILSIIASSLLLLGGLLGLAITALIVLVGDGEDLSSINLLVTGTLAGLAGGGAGLYHSIRALMRRPSAPFSLPSFWVLFALTIVILGAGVALFATNQPTGPVALIELLVLLSGIVPALTVLALGLQTLRPGVTWRRAWLALSSGASLSIGVAIVLELVLTLLLLGAASLNVDLNNLNPSSSFGTIAILILIAVIAPLVEETTKQFSGFFLLPRMKGPQEAFLIGLASGIGFAIVETAGYIGSAQADWAGIALGRVGAGLLHGMGAAMAGVGWYYIFRGKGARGRWRLGIGFVIYAYAQHAIFNGGQEALVAFIKPLQTWHFDIFGLRQDITIVYAGVLYVVILVIMLLVIRWLRWSAPAGAPTAGAGSPRPTISRATYSSRATPNTLSAPNASGAPNTLGIREPDGRELGGAV